ALSSIEITVLLLRGYMKSRARLLFWSGLCFTELVLNNLLLVIDVRVVPEIDLSLVRTIPALIGILLLVYGLIWQRTGGEQCAHRGPDRVLLDDDSEHLVAMIHIGRRQRCDRRTGFFRPGRKP